ncbi:hypothetical protein [Nocardioides dongxiaopingii]|uniref:hypothetical protein n=1 Tax=Nocardioides dongxiaopingii TaxID=2576036 RepID=UPI0010C7659D|nr:hypothetical protein [Nocardioides dongxiaopingii]
MRTLVARRRRRPPARTSPLAGPPEASEHERLPQDLTPSEWAAVMDLLRDEIARGWVPRPSDVEAARAVLQVSRRIASGHPDR